MAKAKDPAELLSTLSIQEDQDPQQKYIAAGFLEDLTRFMAKYAGLSSFNFKDFKEIFQEEKFNLIFKGRPDQKELDEIRIEFEQMKIVTSLKKLAISNNLKHLHYIIDYLNDNAFLYVQHQKLMGPLTRMEPKKKDIDDEIVSFANTYKGDFLEYTTNNRLETLKKYKEKYMDAKTKFVLPNSVTEDTGVKFYEEALAKMEEIKHPVMRKKNDIASRRERLRAKAFSSKAKDRHGATSDREEEPENVGKKKNKEKQSTPVYPRRKRAPQDQRRVGRPSRKEKIPKPVPEPSSDEDIDTGHLLESYPFTEENTRKVRVKRNPYYVDKPDETSDEQLSDGDDEAVDVPDSANDDDPVNESLSVPFISME